MKACKVDSICPTLSNVGQINLLGMPQIKKTWPRIRKVDNGEARTSYSVDLRPYGPRKYFASEAEAKGEAQIQRIRLMNEGAESFQFSAEQRTDAKAALHILEGTGL